MAAPKKLKKINSELPSKCKFFLAFLLAEFGLLWSKYLVLMISKCQKLNFWILGTCSDYYQLCFLGIRIIIYPLVIESAMCTGTACWLLTFIMTENCIIAAWIRKKIAKCMWKGFKGTNMYKYDTILCTIELWRGTGIYI